ncbi:MAG: restriction endonuclease subunit S [Bacteroidota bacterium]
MKEVSGLPRDWMWVKLGEVCRTTSGGTPSRREPEYYNGNIPWVKSGELDRGVITDTEEKISEAAIKNSSAKVFPKGTLLIALYGATIGKLAFLGVDAATNQAICGIYQNEKISSFFLYNYLFYKKQKLVGQGIGGAQPNISQTILKELDLPLPPKATQEAIVSKIEELFSELDKGIENLRTAQQQLKTYRQAVLKWAFEGNEKTGTPFSEIILSYQNGISKRSATEGEPFKVLRLADIKGGEINSKEPREIKLSKSEIEKYKLNDNDIIAIRVNGSKELVGRFVLVNTKNEWAFCDHFIRIRLDNKMALPEFIKYYAESRSVRRFIELNMVSSAGQNTISQTTLSSLEIKLPSIEEQNKTVQEIESRFIVADKMEESITQSLQQAEALRQSILKKAFEGRLS